MTKSKKSAPTMDTQLSHFSSKSRTFWLGQTIWTNILGHLGYFRPIQSKSLFLRGSQSITIVFSLPFAWTNFFGTNFFGIPARLTVLKSVNIEQFKIIFELCAFVTCAGKAPVRQLNLSHKKMKCDVF